MVLVIYPCFLLIQGVSGGIVFERIALKSRPVLLESGKG